MAGPEFAANKTARGDGARRGRTNLPDENTFFLSVRELAERIRTKQLSPVELAEGYLERSRKIGPKLNAYATVTEDLAREQARAAEKEIAAGHYRGPLHGVPYAAKDLVAVPGYPTTWGAIRCPAVSCGVSGLRPSFGRIPRFGAMAIAYTMDKLGPMARTADDCGLVLSVIAGHDPRDHDSLPPGMAEFMYPSQPPQK